MFGNNKKYIANCKTIWVNPFLHNNTIKFICIYWKFVANSNRNKKRYYLTAFHFGCNMRYGYPRYGLSNRVTMVVWCSNTILQRLSYPDLLAAHFLYLASLSLLIQSLFVCSLSITHLSIYKYAILGTILHYYWYCWFLRYFSRVSWISYLEYAKVIFSNFNHLIMNVFNLIWGLH